MIGREPATAPRDGPSTRAVVLLSGGLDSTTVLAMARATGRRVYAMSFDYGQRHAVELECARRHAAAAAVVAHEVVRLDALGALVKGASSLLSTSSMAVPKSDESDESDDAAIGEGPIPSTYVPARNTVFLSWALAWAEAVGATEIWIGANAVDYSGYPDCRGEFLVAWERAARLGTRAGVEGEGITVVAPLLDLPKSDIIARGVALGVDYADTVSCYDATTDAQGPVACRRCESCRLREAGFARAGVDDPTRYRT